MPFKPILVSLITSSFCILWAEPVRLSPEQAVARALQSNPSLKIGQRLIEQSEATLRYAGQLKNPEVKLAFRNDWLGDDAGEQDIELGITQNLPITPHRKKERIWLERERDEVKSEIDHDLCRLAFIVEAAAIELAIKTEQRALLQRQIDVNQTMVTFLKNRSQFGEISPLDITQAKLTGKQLEAEQRALVVEQKAATLHLQQLMGTPLTEELIIDADLSLPATLSTADLSEEAINHPSVVHARQAILVAEAKHDYEASKKYEDIQLGLTLSQEKSEDQPEGLDRNHYIGIGFSMPLPLRRANQQALASAEANIAKAKTELEITQAQLTYSQARIAARRKQAFHLAKEASGDVIQLAEQNLKAYQDAQATGQASFLQVQRAQETLIKFKSAALEAVAEYHRAETVFRARAHTEDIP